MIFNMVGGGGAGGASIFIVNSVNQRPTNVFNNTLWVDTDVDVVKYIFSDNEPSNPTEGMLWLTISNSDNVNVAAPINKDWMKFNLGIVRQYIGGVWERKIAQLYKDGIWVNVSKIFAAYIDITYPANSACIVTNSIGQTIVSDTNTTSSEKTFTAIVGTTGTYTVTATATDGSGKSKSETVEITAEGQSVSVALSYALILYDNGTQNVAWIGYDQGGHDDAKLNSTYMSIEPCGYMPYLYTKNKVSTTGYSKLCVEYKSKYTRDDGFSFGTSNDTNLGNNYDVSFVSKKSVLDESETKKTAECPITSGSFNIVIQSGFEDLTYSGSAYIYIYKVWLE